MASLLGVVSSTPAAEAQQTPNRPLLIVGGTLGPADFPDLLDMASWLDDEFDYTLNQDLFITSLAEPDVVADPPNIPKPPNWPGFRLLPYYVPSWGAMVDLITSQGGSTAGLGSMEDSTQWVKQVVAWILASTQEDEIDIIGISQGAPVVRKYIRNAVEDGEGNPVNRMISFSGANNGVPTNLAHPAFVDWIGNWWEALLGSWFEDALEDCRDENWLPMCPGMFVSDAIPNNTPSNFLPDLNDPASPGPVPGPTDYYHVYSDQDEEGNPLTGEGGAGWILPNEANVLNISAQGFCAMAGTPYPVGVGHADLISPIMRELVAFGLGYRLPNPSVCPDTT